MGREHCPHCRKIVETVRTTIKIDKGAQELKIDSFHCTECRKFIRDEEYLAPKEKPTGGKDALE